MADMREPRSSMSPVDEEEPVEPDESIFVPLEYRDLHASKESWAVSKLWQTYMAGKLNLQAEFQREYVWDDKRASRFVESLLLNLPVPPVFLAENRDGSWDVVDGHQRLESLFGFLQPLSAGPAADAMVRPAFRALKLRDLEVLGDELDGRGVGVLPVTSRHALLQTELGVIIIPKTASPDLKFALFARLNLGSVPLNSQELRNCLYRGRYNDLIKEITSDAEVLRLLGKKSPDKRMRDREQVLRFFAFAHRLGQFRQPLRMFLNDEMEANRHCDIDERKTFKTEFYGAMELARKVLGQEVCRLFRLGSVSNPRGRWDRWTELIYEVELVEFSKYAKQINGLLAGTDVNSAEFLAGLRHHLIGVMTGANFLQTLNEGTTRPNNVQDRYKLWDHALVRAIEHPDFVCDRFRHIKSALRQSTLCEDCSSAIDSLDDTDLSLQGGVAHRFCLLLSLRAS
jgi:hypothetical protein